MTRGELIRERIRNKVEDFIYQEKEEWADFFADKADGIGTILCFIAGILFIGAIGNIDISEVIPKDSILIAAFSMAYMIIWVIRDGWKE